jgi:hypothetical protein
LSKALDTEVLEEEPFGRVKILRIVDQICGILAYSRKDLGRDFKNDKKVGATTINQRTESKNVSRIWAA